MWLWLLDLFFGTARAAHDAEVVELDDDEDEEEDDDEDEEHL